MLKDLGQPTVTINTNILDIEVPKQLEVNVPTGFAHVDALFAGDGATPSTAALVTGQPGLGKTTLMLQIADAVTATGNIAIYNTGEESLYQVRKVVRRLELRHGFIPSYEATAQAIVAKAKAVQKKYPKKQVFLFVDSLQCVELERKKGKRGRDAAGANKELQATAILTQWAKDTFGILMLIGMSTKKGDFAGTQKIRHVVDAHLHLEIDSDRKSETYGQRVAVMTKNRFGLSGLAYVFEITKLGVAFECGDDGSMITA